MSSEFLLVCSLEECQRRKGTQQSVEEAVDLPPIVNPDEQSGIVNPLSDSVTTDVYCNPSTLPPARTETETPVPTEPSSTISTPISSRRSSGFGPSSLPRLPSSANFIVAAALAALAEEEEFVHNHDNPPSYEEATSVHASRQPSRQTSRQVSRRNSIC